MMISGYVYELAYWNKNDGAVCKSRLRRQIENIISVYLVYSIAFGLLQYGSAKFTNAKRTIRDILLIGIKPIDPYWYLYVLVCCYIAFAFLRANRCRNGVLIVLTISAILSGWIKLDWFAMHDFLHYALFFYVGAMLQRNQAGILDDRKFVVASFLGAMILIATTWNSTVITEQIRIDNIPIVSTLVGAGCAMAIWYAFRHVPYLHHNRFFAMIGKYSLEVYVIHCVFTAGFRTVFPRIGITNGYISIALNVVLSTAVPILFSKLCTAFHVHDLFFKPASYFQRAKV